MAYLDTTYVIGSTASVAGLSDRERDIVSLAYRDGLVSLGRPSRLRRFAGLAFGLQLPNALADERLEALRRFAILVANGADSRAARVALATKDFSWVQIEEAASLATMLRRSRATRMPKWGPAASDAVAWAGAFVWVRLGVGGSFFAALAAAYYGLPAPISSRPIFH